MKTENFFKSKISIITLFAACFVVLISLGVRQTFGLFFMDFNESLSISNTAFGFAMGMQMLMWGLTGPIFGAVADRYGGHIAIISAFIFYVLGIYFLYTGPNTGIFFQIHMGLLVGIGLGGTAISIPMSVVGKHFPLSTRTIAMSFVTALGSFGYFLSPIFTNYSLKLFGYGYSWGGFESLVLHQEYRETGNRKYLSLAKDEHLVRLHIGLEDPNDLIKDIKQALKYLK